MKMGRETAKKEIKRESKERRAGRGDTLQGGNEKGEGLARTRFGLRWSGVGEKSEKMGEGEKEREMRGTGR